jgi:sugar lactone lactonase YvrE
MSPARPGWISHRIAGWLLAGGYLVAPAVYGQQSRPAFRLLSPHWHIESIAFDGPSRTFFLGDVRHRQVWVRSTTGRFRPLLTSDHRLWAVLGMAVDEQQRALWIASAAIPPMQGYQPADAGCTALFRCSLSAPDQLVRFEPPADDQPHAFGDVVLDHQGSVYVSDSQTPVLYRLSAGSSQLERWLSLPGYSLQGMAVSADGQRLYVADYGTGLFVVDLQTKGVRRLELPRDANLRGIDGLCRVGDQLLAIQNGMGPQRIVALRLAADGHSVERVRLLEGRVSVLPEPTLGTQAGNWFYFVADSPWSRYGTGQPERPRHRLRRPAGIRRIKLRSCQEGEGAP